MHRVVVLFVAALLVGTAAAPSRVTVRVVGGSPHQRALVHAVLVDLKPVQLRVVEIRPAFGQMRFAILGRGRGRSMRRSWETLLLAGVVSSRSGVRVLAGTPDGGAQLVSPRRAPTSKLDAASFRARIVAAVKREHVRLAELSIHEPGGLAAAVVVEVKRPGLFIRDRLDPFLARIGDRFTEYEGMYVEVRDRRGRLVLRLANASRAGTGMESAVRAYSGCRPVLLGALLISKPLPPCPTR